MTAVAGRTGAPARGQRLAAALALALSVVGLGVSAQLTVLKFRIEHTPCLVDANVCRVGGMDCNAALQSGWSTALGLPVSVWSGALYVVMLGLAADVLVRGAFFRGVAPTLLLVSAGVNALASAVMAAHAFTALELQCPYCVALYVVSALLLIAGALTHRTPRGQGERPRLRERPLDVLDAAFVFGVLLVTAAGVQSVAYQYARRGVDPAEGCAVARERLPDPALRVGPAAPDAIVALFLDLSCRHCAREFLNVARAVQQGLLEVPTQVWIFHAPQQVCAADTLPPTTPEVAHARNNNACLAARAAVCVEALRPGTGLQTLGALFGLQGDPDSGPLFTALKVGECAVDLGLEIDPDEPDNPLFRCIDGDTAVLERIVGHQRYAIEHGLHVPAGFVYPVRDGEPVLDAAHVIHPDYAPPTIAEVVRGVVRRPFTAP